MEAERREKGLPSTSNRASGHQELAQGYTYLAIPSLLTSTRSCIAAVYGIQALLWLGGRWSCADLHKSSACPAQKDS
jgi:hypothetical protein